MSEEDMDAIKAKTGKKTTLDALTSVIEAFLKEEEVKNELATKDRQPLKPHNERGVYRI